MTLNRCVVPVLALFMAATGAALASAAGVPQPQRAGYGQDRDGWDAPPSEWKEIQRRGFQEGIEGARKDIGNNRRPDVNNREEYRHPTLPYELREPYREGFRRGYERAVSHLMSGREEHMREPDRPMHPPESRGRDVAQQLQQSGFQDGMEGARKDFGNHRRLDVNNREEYRRPNLPFELQRDYREGFRRGYEKVTAEFTGRHDRN
jgi:hypothetical protein